MNFTDGLILLLSLFTLGLSTFRHLETSRRYKESQDRWRKRQQSVESELGKLRGVIGELHIRLGDSAAAMPASPPSAQGSLNLNRRTQAIRLFRRGERPERVAEMLTMPQQETALLWKVYKTISAPAQPVAPGGEDERFSNLQSARL